MFSVTLACGADASPWAVASWTASWAAALPVSSSRSRASILKCRIVVSSSCGKGGATCAPPQGRASGEAGLVQAVGLVVNARLNLERDVHAIPAIDGHDRKCQVGNFLFGKLRAHALVGLIGDAVGRDLRQYFGPRQAGALARREQGGFTPDGDMVQAQRPLTVDGRVLDVHVHAERAAVDLGNAQLDQFANGFLDGRVAQRHAEFEKLLREFRGLLLVVDAHWHNLVGVR